MRELAEQSGEQYVVYDQRARQIVASCEYRSGVRYSDWLFPQGVQHQYRVVNSVLRKVDVPVLRHSHESLFDLSSCFFASGSSNAAMYNPRQSLIGRQMAALHPSSKTNAL